MTLERKRLFTVVFWNPVIIFIWAVSLWAFGGQQYLEYYLSVSILFELISLSLIWRLKGFLFWYFLIGSFVYLSSMVFGLSLITGTLLILAFRSIVTPDLIMTGTLLFFAVYCFFPLKYYYDDYKKTEKDRLKSFDFDTGTYDITRQSLMREDAFADYYTKSFLSNAYSGIIKLHILFPLSGGAIAIIAGNISKNLQLGIGIVAAFLSTITFIQFGIPGVFNAWQVLQLEKKYGKKIRILWGDESEKTKD